MSWVQLVVIVLVLGSSAISAIAKKLKEQAEIKRIQEERQRQREDQLRTGRGKAGAPGTQPAPVATGRPAPRKSPSAGPRDPRQRLQELADRRRAQLEELRRKQQQQKQQVSGAPTRQKQPARPTAQRGPTAATPPRSRQPKGRQPIPSQNLPPAPPPKRPAVSASQHVQPTQANRPVSQRPQAGKLSNPERPKHPPHAQQLAGPPVQRERSTVVRTGREAPGVVALKSGSPRELRQAIIMMELLAPPLALRRDQSSL